MELIRNVSINNVMDEGPRLESMGDFNVKSSKIEKYMLGAFLFKTKVRS